MNLGLPNVFRNRSRASSNASSANTSSSNHNSNPQPVLDFTTRINELKKSYIGRDGNRKPKHYVPETELANYWTKPRVREISQAYTPHLTIKFDLVNKRCLRLFSILVYIDRVQYFDTLQSKISDAQLPIVEDDLPQALKAPAYEEVLQDLFKHQWLFCPLVLDYALLTDLHLETDHILPFCDEEKLKDGDAAHVFKMTVNRTCNRLDGPSDAVEDRIYVLKSYSHERYRRLYLNESKALTTLQQPGSEHIVGYYGSFKQSGTFNLLLQFADGGNLLDYYGENKPPSDPADICMFWKSLLGILKGLHCVHQIHPSSDDSGEYRGIHEDIKPDNIILNNGPSKSPYDFFPLLADFGHSHFRVPKSEDDDMGVDRQGNQTYGAPESSHHAKYLVNLPSQIPTAADIFSIGCVLSDAAAWVVLGMEGRELYQSLRIEAGSRVESFEDESYHDCFHNAVDRSKAVDGMHARIREACHPEDTITPVVLDLVQNKMLVGAWKERLASRELYERFRHELGLPDSEKKKGFKAMAATTVEGAKTGAERFARGLSDSVPFRNRKPDVEEQLRDDHAEMIDAQSKLDSEDSKVSLTLPAIVTVGLASKIFRRKGKEAEKEKDESSPPNDGPATSESREDNASPGPPPPIKLSASPTLPPRRPGPHAHIPNDTSSLTPLSDGRNSFSDSWGSPTDPVLSPFSDISTLLSPPLGQDNQLQNSRPTTPTDVVDDPQSVAKLELLLEEARGWRVDWKSYQQLNPEKHGIIKSLQRSLRGRDHIFFVDDSRTMKQHTAEVEVAFETLAYMVKPQDGKEWGTVSLALDLSTPGDGKKKKSLHTNSSKTTSLLNILKTQCTYDRVEDMMEDRFSTFIDEEIIPLLPSQTPHRELVTSLADNGKSNSLQRSLSASKKKRPISVIVFTDGQWGNGKIGAGVDNPITRLIKELKDRELKRTQVMIQFVQFGDSEDGARHLQYLSQMGRDDTDKDKPCYNIVDTQPITGNVCAMLIGSIGGTHISRDRDTSQSPNTDDPKPRT